MEGCVCRVPLLVRDRGGGALEEGLEGLKSGIVERSDGTLGREQLECEPHLVAVCECLRGHRRDVVATSGRTVSSPSETSLVSA